MKKVYCIELYYNEINIGLMILDGEIVRKETMSEAIEVLEDTEMEDECGYMIVEMYVKED
jgi:hypothetical protein